MSSIHLNHINSKPSLPGIIVIGAQNAAQNTSTEISVNTKRDYSFKVLIFQNQTLFKKYDYLRN